MMRGKHGKRVSTAPSPPAQRPRAAPLHARALTLTLSPGRFEQRPRQDQARIAELVLQVAGPGGVLDGTQQQLLAARRLRAARSDWCPARAAP